MFLAGILAITANAALYELPMKKGEMPPAAFKRYAKVQKFEPIGADLEKRIVIVESDKPIKGAVRAVEAPKVLAQGYRTHDEVNAYLDRVVDAYPKWAMKRAIGKTAEGREIFALRLRYPGVTTSPRLNNLSDRYIDLSDGTGATVDRNGKLTLERKSVYFDALHHAREIATPDVALDIVAELLEKACANKETDEAKWLKAFDVWVVPMVNPDGSERVWSGRNTMQRKNGRQVDNNRNYKEEWASCRGSSPNPGDEQYRGPSALSEKENQAVVSLLDEIRPVAAITYHSFSEMVLYPPGCPGRPRDAKVEALGQRIARALVRDSGSGTYAAGTSYDLLYPTDGDTTAALFGRYGTLAFTVEISASSVGFHPPYEGYRDDLVRRQRPGWRILLEEAHRIGKGG